LHITAPQKVHQLNFDYENEWDHRISTGVVYMIIRWRSHFNLRIN